MDFFPGFAGGSKTESHDFDAPSDDAAITYFLEFERGHGVGLERIESNGRTTTILPTPD